MNGPTGYLGCEKLTGWSDYVNGIPWTVAKTAGNDWLKIPRVPGSRLIATRVQHFVRERRQIRQRTIAKDVMDYGENKKDVHAAL